MIVSRWVVLLGTYAVGMASGQVLFKIGCATLSGKRGGRRTTGKPVGKTYFFVAFAFYCALAICWVWILASTPLSRAYPFVALAFAITPILGGWLFEEPINLRLGFGITAIEAIRDR